MTCGYCGKENVSIINEDGTGMCVNCFQQAGTCALCAAGTFCDFETNPINLPKQEQKTIRQGNMIIQTVIKSESRIRETCLKNCPCYDPDFGCLKENGTCGKYAEMTLNRSEEENI